jgi:hypothetical protein
MLPEESVHYSHFSNLAMKGQTHPAASFLNQIKSILNEGQDLIEAASGRTPTIIAVVRQDARDYM